MKEAVLVNTTLAQAEALLLDLEAMTRDRRLDPQMRRTATVALESLLAIGKAVAQHLARATASCWDERSLP